MPEQLGKYYFYQTVSYSLNALLFVPIDFFQQSEVFRLGRKGCSLGGLLAFNAKILLIVGTLFAVCAVGCGFLETALLSALCVTMFLAVTLYASTAMKNFLNNQEDQLFVVSMLVAEIPVKLLVFWGIVKIGQAGPLSPLIATVLSYVIVGVPVMLRARYYLGRFQGEAELVDLHEVLHFSAPISLASVLNWIQLQGYRLVLVPLGFAETVGLFATTSTIGNSGMNGAATIYQQIYLPKVYQTAGAYLGKYLRGLTIVTAFVLCVGIGLRSELVRLLTNERFVAYGWLIAYGVLIEAGNFIITALVVKLTLDKCTREQIKANVVATVVVPIIFLALFLLHHLNVYTIGIPLVAAQTVVVVFLIYQSEINPWKSQRKPEEATISLL
jgi:hypothetical protein